ncbi:C4-dicarboxylate TRAP transporter substrate-binding protein [uncultured Roseicyclus sp.]|jgi:C4-dicarboxylate-binding protein DctP|uniref:C4-dicarboxylate TRAP transporter substrate-binding protein n=1 Tax=uncultured Roseicyclus sp. TaxID=543072 RepID=UPI002605C6B1|nr:C4-dicarboxylate TRAP transporter substrate-binding protein [uncultured Roseicyclus sp.]
MNIRTLATSSALATGVIALGASAALADTFTLRIGSGHPDGPSVYVSDVANFFVPEVVRRVSEETDHEIEFVQGYGGAIVGVADTLEAVQDGILDIGAYCMCFETAKLFLHNFPYWAPFGPQSSSEQVAAVRAVYDQVPWLTEQFSSQYGQEMLGLHGWDNYHLGTTDPWETIADLQGVKVGGAGPNLPWLEFAGAVPVQSTLPEGYLSLQTGVYNGWLMFPSAYLGFKYYEPAPYYTLVGFGAMAVNVLTMNTRSLAAMPAEVQQIIREVGAAYEAGSGASLDGRQAAGLTGLKDAGAIITELSQETRTEWAASMAQFPRQQIAEANTRGLPGTEVMGLYLKAVADLGYAWPFEYTLE